MLSRSAEVGVEASQGVRRAAIHVSSGTSCQLSWTLISVRPIGRTGQERRAPSPGDVRDVIAGASTPTAVNGSDSGGTPMR